MERFKGETNKKIKKGKAEAAGMNPSNLKGLSVAGCCGAPSLVLNVIPEIN